MPTTGASMAGHGLVSTERRSAVRNSRPLRSRGTTVDGGSMIHSDVALAVMNAICAAPVLGLRMSMAGVRMSVLSCSPGTCFLESGTPASRGSAGGRKRR